MNKVLIISTHFAPDTHIGAKRVTQFAKNLPQFGWQPIILTKALCDYEYLDEGLNDEIQGMNIIRVKQWRLRKKAASSGSNSGAIKKKLNLIKQVIIYLEQYISFDYGWLIPAFWMALRLVKKYEIGIVFASSPNPESLVICYLLKKFKGIKLVCDYRDPWTDRPYLKVPKIRDWIDNALEKSILSDSDLVTTTGMVLREDLINRYSLKKPETFKVIYNGYDKDLIGIHRRQNERNDGKLQITFWGTLKWFITPEYFLRGLSIFLEREKEAKSKICVNFLGRIVGEGLINITDDLLNKLELKEVVSLVDFLPYKEGIARLYESDVLLLIVPKYGGFTKYRVPAKLFEYMYINKPILGLVPLDGECAKLIRQTAIGRIADPEDIEAIAKVLGEIYADFKNGYINYKPIYSEIKKFNRVVLTEKLAEYLSNI